MTAKGQEGPLQPQRLSDREAPKAAVWASLHPSCAANQKAVRSLKLPVGPGLPDPKICPLNGLALSELIRGSATQLCNCARKWQARQMVDSQALDVARARISRESDALTGHLDLGQLGLTELPAELFGLKHLRRLNLGSGMFGEHEQGEWVEACSQIAPNQLDATLADLSRLPGLSALSVRGAILTSLNGIQSLSTLQSLVCSRTQISDLSPLAELRQLQVLICSRTNVNDLAPLKELQRLQELNCARTPVASLATLAGSTNLRILSCARTFISDLAPLSQWAHLEELHCQGTKITDLAPLAGLSKIRVLNCARTQIKEITPLAALKKLRVFVCARTRISDLAPLQGMDGLIDLRCSSTKVEDITPLTTLRRLEKLVCTNTRIKDLTPLEALGNLKHLNLSQCNLMTVRKEFWLKRSIRELILFETRLVETPPEVLSQDADDNCLHSLRAHFRDLQAGVSNIPDIKMVVLGNGGIGKTQLCRRICGENYDSRVPSTHGIIITSTGLAMEDQEEPTILRTWDFGGQDIYHGTHILFMRTGAIFVVVWIPQSEPEQVWKGMRFRNQPLSYWIGAVRRLGKRGSPLIVVQTRCDRLEDEVHRLPVPPELLKALPHWELRYSALNDRGRAALDEALREAVTRVRQNYGFMSMGSGRFRVKRRLEALRDADAAVTPEQRQYRTLTQEYFRQLCDEAGGISSPKHFLYYLHNAGVVFYSGGYIRRPHNS